MTMRTYGPGNVSLIIGGTIIKGRIEINIEYPNDRYTESQDVDGGITRVENSNWRFCNMTVSMEQGATDNGSMQDAFLLGAVLPVLVKDNSGNDIHSVSQASFRKQPDATYGQEATPREWSLFGNAEIAYLGGNN